MEDIRRVSFSAEDIMKKLVGLLVFLTVGFGGPRKAHSQVSFYGDFSASKLTYLSNTNVLYGPIIGSFVDVATFGRVNLSADIRPIFVGASGVRLDGVVVRPRFATAIRNSTLR